ncbi:hypothetical protein C2G38_2044080 [Gigaspora rosea]|uniref:Uncharacterized protein n=1 Tax=Gigaspora rosea TaxID=44941 RepID=A0A397UQL0_9GLOM|nr:hypothetical protein C2G38_2044080 [Gigaspora rosea]
MSEEVADIIPKGTADITFEKAVGVASKRAENTILEKVADTKKAENAILEEIAATKGAENAILEEVADKTTKNIAFRNLKGSLYPCVGLRSQDGFIEVNFGSKKFKFAVTISNDTRDELLKNKLIEAFNICINSMNTYILEDLENLLKIKQDTLLYTSKLCFLI